MLFAERVSHVSRVSDFASPFPTRACVSDVSGVSDLPSPLLCRTTAPLLLAAGGGRENKQDVGSLTSPPSLTAKTSRRPEAVAERKVAARIDDLPLAPD